MIRHAGSCPALTILALPVAMIEPPFRALLVPAIGSPPLMNPGLSAAGDAAIALSAVTARAEKENGAASGIKAKPLPQNYFIGRRHPSSQRDWTTALAPWQVGTSLCVVTSRRLPYRNPAAEDSGVPGCFPPSMPNLQSSIYRWMIGRMIRAFGADDVARLRLVFRKLRFQMIADNQSGEFNFHCTIHSNMHGKIIVQ